MWKILHNFLDKLHDSQFYIAYKVRGIFLFGNILFFKISEMEISKIAITIKNNYIITTFFA